MVAIVGGQGNGLGHSNQSQLGRRGQFGSEQTGKAGERSYVNVASGNLIVQDKDAVLIGVGDDISVLRTYNSLGKLRDDNGDNWWINGYRRIEKLSGPLNKAGSSVERIGHDGTSTVYRFDVARSMYVAESGSGEFDTLNFADNRWTWTDIHSHVSETYEGSAGTWRLTEHNDGQGNINRFQYQGDLLARVQNANGEAMVFGYSGRNLIQEKILKSDGSVYGTTHYRYDAQSRLQQVLLDLSPEDGTINDAKVFVTSYTYVGNSNLLESITQTDGYYQRYSYVEINGESRVASITDAYNNVTRFDYDTVQRQTKVTDAFGNANVYRYDELGRFLEIRLPTQSGAGQKLSYNYDSSGNLASITDAYGSTEFQYDTSGNLLSEKDVLGNRSEYRYDDQNNRILKRFIPIDGAEQLTRYVYDTKNQLRFVIAASGGVDEYRYDSQGNRSTEISYNDTRYILAANATASLSLLEAWSAAQPVTSLSRTDFSYDERAQLRSRTQFMKLTADGKGVQDGTESVNRYIYDVQGNLLTSIDPLNFQTSYSYDGLGRVLTSVNAQQQSTSYSYDDSNHKVITRQANGRVDTEVYDQRNLLLSQSRGQNLNAEFAYDALGRLVYSKDATGLEQLQVYDEAGHLSAIVNARGEVTEYRYDQSGQKTQTILRATTVSATQFQQLKGQLIQNHSPILNKTPAAILTPPLLNPEVDVLTSNAAYKVMDAVGRLRFAVKADGTVFERIYDAAGRVLEDIEYSKKVSTPVSSDVVNKLGRNLLTNPALLSYANSWPEGWTYNFLGQDVTEFGSNKSQTNFLQADENALYWSQNRRSPSDTYQEVSQTIDIQAGKSYAFSAICGADRVKVSVSIVWLDKNGAVIGQTAEDANSSSMEGYPGGPTRESYIKLSARAVAPIGATQAKAVVRKSNNSRNIGWASAYLMRPVFEELPANSPLNDEPFPIQRTSQDKLTRYAYDEVGLLRYKLDSNGSLKEWRYDSNKNLVEEVRYNDKVLGEVGASFFNFAFKNRLQNSSFSSGASTWPPEWIKASINSQKFSFGVKSGAIKDVGAEENLAYIESTSVDTNESVEIYQDLDVVAGKNYSFSIYFGSTSYATSPKTLIRWLDSTGNVLGSTTATDGAFYIGSPTSLQHTFRNINKGQAPVGAVKARVTILQTFSGKSTLFAIRPQFEEIASLNDAPSKWQPSLNINKASRKLASDYVYTSFDPVVLPQDWGKNSLLANLNFSASANDLIKTSYYDKAGRLGAEVNPLGEVTEYRYNGAGQLVQTIQRASALNLSGLATNVTAEALPIVANSADRINTRFYDADGLLRATIDAEGSVIEYRYDAAGRKIASVAYAQRQPSAQPGWSLDQIFIASPGKDAITYHYYDAQNQLVATVDAEGAVSEYRYDQAHQQILSRRYAKAIDLAGLFGGGKWDASKVSKDDLKDEVIGLKYDELGRVIAKSLRGSETALSEKYEYDQKTGLLISQTRNANSQLSSTTQYRYDEFGRIIASLSGIGSEKLKANPANSEQIWHDYATTFSYDAANRKTSSTDANGFRTLYYYDQAGRLTHTINAIGEVSERRYNALGQLTDTLNYAKRLANLSNYSGGLITDSLVNALSQLRNTTTDALEHYAYDSVGNLLVKTDGNGVQTRYSYNHFGEQETQTSVIDDNRNVVSKTQYNKRGQVVERIADLSGNPRNETIEYDSFGRIARIKDGNGNVKETSYDRQGRVVEVRDNATGEKSGTQYDALDRIIYKTDSLLQSTQYLYNKTVDGWRIETISPEGVKHALEKSESGEVLWESVGDVKTSYRYNADGLRIKTTDARSTNSKANVNDYDNAGRLSDSFDANGNQVHYDYDAANRVIRRTVILADGKKLVSATEYDALGRSIKTTDVNGISTSFEFDQIGQLIKQTLDPDGLKLVTLFSYDKRGKTLSVTRLGEAGKNQVERYEYDNLGRRVREFQGGLLVHSYLYDNNSNLVARFDYPFGEGGLRYLTRMVYDSQNRLTYKIDATGRVNQTIYDSNGAIKQQLVYDQVASANSNSSLSASEIQSVLRGNKIVVQTNDYDKDGRLLSSVDASGVVTRYYYDARGNIARKTLTDPSTSGVVRETRFAYDAANRLVLEIGADGSVTKNDYDQGENIVSQTHFATTLNLAGLSGASDLTAYTALLTPSSADRVTRMAYDNANRLVYSVDAEGYVSYREYQGARLVKQTQYATAVQLTSSDLATIQNAVRSDINKDRVSQYRFDAAGNLLESTDALGYRENYTYNALGQKTSFTNKNGATWNYEYDQAGRLVKEIAPAVEVSEALVDGAGRLTGVVQRSWQRLETVLGYDALGNLSKRTEAAGTPQERTTQYFYDAQGRQIISVFPATEVYDAVKGVSQRTVLATGVDYDVLGNATRNRDVAGNYSYKVYDNAGRVRYDIDAAGYVTEYQRNAYGDVIALTRYAQAASVSYDEASKRVLNFSPTRSAQDRVLRTRYTQRGEVEQVIEPSSFVFTGSEGRNEAKVTRQRYNAFGEVIATEVSSQVIDANGNLLSEGQNLAITRFAYNRQGLQVAVLDAENYLTRKAYDGLGQLLQQTEFATAYTGNWSETGDGLPGVDAYVAGSQDRALSYQYDANGRKIKESKLNAEFAVLSGIGRAEENLRGTIEISYRYDHLGNLVASVEQELDPRRQANPGTAGIALLTRSSYRSYDALGRVASTLGNSSGVNAKAILTEYQRDAYGNAVRSSEREVFTTGQLVTEDGLVQVLRAGQSLAVGQSLVSANGRNQLILQSDGNLVLYRIGAQGVKQAVWWTNTVGSGADRLLMQADGNLVLQKAGTTIWSSNTSASQAVLSLNGRDTVQVESREGNSLWSSPAPANLKEQGSDQERVSLTRYNSQGKAVQVRDALNYQSEMRYDAAGRLSYSQSDVSGSGTDKISQVSQSRYDARGNLIETRSYQEGQAAASQRRSITTYEYNAFGEVTVQQKGQNPGLQVRWDQSLRLDYDNAGRVWRSNTEGSWKVSLSDRDGRVTAQITSDNDDLSAYSSAAAVYLRSSQAAGEKHYQSTLTRYNKLGLVTQVATPSNGPLGRVATQVSNQGLSYTVTGKLSSQRSWIYDANGEGHSQLDWTGSNQIEVSAPGLETLGSGDIKVRVEYRTSQKVEDQSTASYDARFSSADSKGKLIVSWPNQTDSEFKAQDAITRVVVSKKNAQGAWEEVGVLGNTGGAGSIVVQQTRVMIAAPADLAIVPTFRYRLLGSSDWKVGRLLNFGANYVFDPKNANPDIPRIPLYEGNYEYQVEYIDTRSRVSLALQTGTLGTEGGPSRQNAAQLFVALYNRAPTATELTQLSEAIAASSLEVVATNVLNSASFAGKTGEDILNLIYRGALKREVDAEGKAFWLTMWNGTDSNAHGKMVTNLIRAMTPYTGNSPEGLRASQLFNNKVQVALSYAFEYGGDDLSDAAVVLQQVTASDTQFAMEVVRNSVGLNESKARIALTRLYVVLQNRFPEKSGLDYWIARLVSREIDLKGVAAQIFAGTGGMAGKSATEIAARIFNEVLNYPNSPEQTALANQLGALGAAANDAQKAGVILTWITNFLEGSAPLEKLEARNAQRLLDCRVRLGLHYAVALQGDELTQAREFNAKVSLADTYSVLNQMQMTAGNAAQIRLALSRMYVMVFNRAPDTEGLSFWFDQLNRANGISQAQVLEAMLAKRDENLDDKSNLTLVKQIYREVLGQTSVEVAADDRWLRALNQAGTNRATVLQNWINELVSSNADGSSVQQKHVFNFKVLNGLNYVSLGGKTEQAKTAVAGSAADVAALDAWADLLKKRAEAAALQGNQTDANLALITTQLADALMQLEAASAKLAYAKALAVSAKTESNEAENRKNTAQSALQTAKDAEKNAKYQLDINNRALTQAQDALAYLQALSEADKSIALQAKIDAAKQVAAEAEKAKTRAGSDWWEKSLLATDAQNDYEKAYKIYVEKQRISDNAENTIKALKGDCDFWDSQAKSLSNQVDEARKKQTLEWWLYNEADISERNFMFVCKMYVLIEQKYNPDKADLSSKINDLLTSRATETDIIGQMMARSGQRSARQFFEDLYYRVLQQYNDEEGISHWVAVASNIGLPNALKIFLGELEKTLPNAPGYAGLSNFQKRLNETRNTIYDQAYSDYAKARYELTDVTTRHQQAVDNYNAADRNLKNAKDPKVAAEEFKDAESKLHLAEREKDRVVSAASGYYAVLQAARAADTKAAQDLAAVSLPPANSGSATIDKQRAAITANLAASRLEDQATKAKADSNRIAQANSANLRAVIQLYVTIFNRPEPDSEGLAFWLNQLQNGGSLVNVADALLNSNYAGVVPAQKDTQSLIRGIYEGAMGRYDNDVAGINFWANQYAAATGTAKAQVILNLINNVLNTNSTDPNAKDGQANFNNLVNLGVSRAAGNATDRAILLGQQAFLARFEADKAIKAYDDAIRAAGGNSGSIDGRQRANNMAHILNVYFVLVGFKGFGYPIDGLMPVWLDKLENQTITMNDIAYEIYKTMGRDGYTSNNLIQFIYSDAMGRSGSATNNLAISGWATQLDRLRGTGDKAAIGEIFVTIAQEISEGISQDLEALQTRTFFNQAMVKEMAKFKAKPERDAAAANRLYQDAQSQLESAKQANLDALAAYNKYSNEINATYRLSTAPEITATPQQLSVARLYAILFNRPPEASALAAWAPQAGNLAQLAQNLLDTASVADRFNGNAKQLAMRIYNNLGGSGSLPADLDALALETISRGQVVANLLNAVLNPVELNKVSIQQQNMLANKVAVGLTYALTLKNDSIEASRKLFDKVTADSATAGIAAVLASNGGAFARSQLAAAYQLLFNRTADVLGYNAWYSIAPRNDDELAWGNLLQQIISSDTSKDSLASTNIDDNTFINRLYANALGREPDREGKVFWLVSLKTQSRGQVAYSILKSVLQPAETAVDTQLQLVQKRLDQRNFMDKVAASLKQLVVEQQNRINDPDAGLENWVISLRLAQQNAWVADQAVWRSLYELRGSIPVAKPDDQQNWQLQLSINPQQTQDFANPERVVVYQEHDRWGNLTSVSDARYAGWKTQYRYDQDNHLLVTTQADGSRSINAYNSLGYQIGSISANGSKKSEYYQDSGGNWQVRQVQDNGVENALKYLNWQAVDASGHVLQNVRPGSIIERNDYNGWGNQTSHIDGEGYATRMSYDLKGQLIEQAQLAKDQAVTVYDYQNVGGTGPDGEPLLNNYQLVSRSINQSLQQFKYDGLGRRVQTSDVIGMNQGETLNPGTLKVRNRRYDEAGNVVSEDLVSHSPDTQASPEQLASYTFDSLGRKLSETKGGKTQYWRYDSNGHLDYHKDLGEHVTRYDYNQAGQLVREYAEAGQVNYHKDIGYRYNAQGLLSQIDDRGTATLTEYQYDANGNRLTEKVTQNGVVLQDNHLGYDELNRLRKIEAGRYSLSHDYDANGNRIHSVSQHTQDIRGYYDDKRVFHADAKGMEIQSVTIRKDNWNAYDDADRQLVADGVLVNGKVGISHEQGHQLSYDGAGRRLSDHGYVNDENPQQRVEVTDIYKYDGFGRHAQTFRSGEEIETRQYTSQGQLARSGASDKLIQRLRTGSDNEREQARLTGLNSESQRYRYDSARPDQVVWQEVQTGAHDHNVSTLEFSYNSLTGNLESYTQSGQDLNTKLTYTYDPNDQYDQYQVSRIIGDRGNGVGTTINQYDANGHLIATRYSKDNGVSSKNDQTYKVDSQGVILSKQAAGVTTWNLQANGEVQGSYTDDGSQASLNRSYLNQAQQASASTSSWTVQRGDSLQSIARAAWGDATLWYLIAEANGLDASSELKAGTQLLLPAHSQNTANNVKTLQPYNPGKLIGDTTPDIPMPAPQSQDGGCGPVGTLFSIATFIILTATFGPAGGFIQGALYAGAASLAGQVGAVAAGEQKDINWKGVGISMLSGGFSAGTQFNLVSDKFVNTTLNAMVANVATQGVAVAVGLQPKFSWVGVAAAGAGSAMGQTVGNWAKENNLFSDWSDKASGIARDTLRGFSASMTATIVSGGKVQAGKILVDAFGNALGDSLAEKNLTAKPENTAAISGMHAQIMQDSYPGMSVPHGPNASMDFSYPYPGGTSAQAIISDEPPQVVEIIGNRDSARDDRSNQLSNRMAVDGSLSGVASSMKPNYRPTIENAQRLRIYSGNGRWDDFKRGYTGSRSFMDGPERGWETAGRYTDRVVNAWLNFGKGVVGYTSVTNATREWKAGNYGRSILHGMQAFGESGLTLASFGTFSAAKSSMQMTVNEYNATRLTYVSESKAIPGALKGSLYSEEALLRFQLASEIRVGLNSDLQAGARIDGLEARGTNPFVNRMQSLVAQEAADIIAEGGKDGIAYARAGSTSTGIVSDGFRNIPSRLIDFPGMQQVAGTNGKFIISDTDAFINGVRDTYELRGQKLNDLTAQQIRDYISRETTFAQQAGVPGLHAEVQAANDLYNKLINPSGALANGDVSVVTYKLGKSSGSGMQGGPFLACTNCGGILPPQINVVTGRKIFQ